MTPENTVLDRVRRIVVEVFDDDEAALELTTTAADVEGWDSVGNIEVMVALEREFDIRFNTGEMASLANVGELVELITRRLGEN